MFGYQISGGQSLVLRLIGVCFLVFLKTVMLVDFWILAPTPSSKLGTQSFFEDKFFKDKDLALKDVPKNAGKSIAPDKSISPEEEGTDAEEETPEL